MDPTQQSTQPHPVRVLVIGGRGFLGRRVVRAFARTGGVTAQCGSRRGESGEVMIDLCAPETFNAVDGFDAVVNCSDTLAAPPDALLDHCLERGIAFVDAGADADTIERILAGSRSSPGVAVVGAGLFPGLSNLLAAEVIATAGSAQALDIEIAINPMSGAGPGTVALMSKAIATHTPRWPEQVMLPVTTAIAPEHVSVSIVPSLRLARPIARVASRLIPRWRWFRRMLAGITGGVFRVVRSRCLRWREAPVAITATAGGMTRGLVTGRGFDATALAVAATTTLVMRKPVGPGCYGVDQVTTVSELVSEMHAMAGDELELRLVPG